MIDRLTIALRALAAPLDVQLAKYRELVVNGNGVAADFADAVRLVLDCPQLELTAEQIAAREAVDAYLEERGDDFWSEEAIRTSTAWATMRGLAASALRRLGAPAATRGDPMG